MLLKLLGLFTILFVILIFVCLIYNRKIKKQKFIFEVINNNIFNNVDLDGTSIKNIKDMSMINKKKYIVVDSKNIYGINNGKLVNSIINKNIINIHGLTFLKNELDWHSINKTIGIVKWVDSISVISLSLSILVLFFGFYYYGEQISYQTKKTQWDNYLNFNKQYQSLFEQLTVINKNNNLQKKRDWTRSYFNLWLDEYRMHKENLIPENMMSDLINNGAIINMCKYKWIKENYNYWIKEGSFTNFETLNNQKLEEEAIIKIRNNMPIYKSWFYNDNDIKLEYLQNKNEFKIYINNILDDMEKHPSCIK